MPKDKLPSYLQPLHQFRPTKPSHGFSGTGLGRLEPQGFKTPGSFQTYLLFTMQTEQAALIRAMQTFISSEGFDFSTHAPNNRRRAFFPIDQSAHTGR